MGPAEGKTRRDGRRAGGGRQWYTSWATTVLGALAVAGPQLALAQVIKEDDAVDRTSNRTRAALDVWGSAFYSSNATGASNLAQDLPQSADSDVIVSEGLRAEVERPLGRRAAIFGSGTAAAFQYGHYGMLNYGALDGQGGLALSVTSKLGLDVSGQCHAELDSHNVFYHYCGPEADASAQVLTIADARSLTRVVLSASYLRAPGDPATFADFNDAAGGILFSRSGPHWSVWMGPEVRYRDFAASPITEAFDKRKDWNLAIPIGVEHSLGKHLLIGLAVIPSVNWSTLDQYRYWSVTVGPTIRYRFEN